MSKISRLNFQTTHSQILLVWSWLLQGLWMVSTADQQQAFSPVLMFEPTNDTPLRPTQGVSNFCMPRRRKSRTTRNQLILIVIAVCNCSVVPVVIVITTVILICVHVYSNALWIWTCNRVWPRCLSEMLFTERLSISCDFFIALKKPGDYD